VKSIVALLAAVVLSVPVVAQDVPLCTPASMCQAYFPNTSAQPAQPQIIVVQRVSRSAKPTKARKCRTDSTNSGISYSGMTRTAGCYSACSRSRVKKWGWNFPALFPFASVVCASAGPKGISVSNDLEAKLAASAISSKPPANHGTKNFPPVSGSLRVSTLRQMVPSVSASLWRAIGDSAWSKSFFPTYCRARDHKQAQEALWPTLGTRLLFH
jgi:hypothetical protein